LEKITNFLSITSNLYKFFFSISVFYKKTNLADPKVLKAIDAANQFGKASMYMLGNSIFAIGKTDELCKLLSSFGVVYICSVDEDGARLID
jgi:pantoate kinase